MLLLNIALPIILSASLACHAAPVNATLYKTGPWTSEEDTIIMYLAKTTPERSRYVEMSKVLGRSPNLIRQHYQDKLDKNLGFNRMGVWYAFENEAIQAAVDYATLVNRPIAFAKLSRDLKRSRPSIYKHYQRHFLKTNMKKRKPRVSDAATLKPSDSSSNIQGLIDEDLSTDSKLDGFDDLMFGDESIDWMHDDTSFSDAAVLQSSDSSSDSLSLLDKDADSTTSANEYDDLVCDDACIEWLHDTIFS